MILTSPLVLEKVWLDKPKYDAAERRYYERLTQSTVTSKTEVGPSSTTNSDVVCAQSELSKVPTIEGNVNLEENNEITVSSSDLKVDVCTKPGNTSVKDVSKQADGKVSLKTNSPVTKKKPETVLQPQKGEDMKKATKEEILTPLQTKKEPNACNVPSKSEKQKKGHSSPPKGKTENVPKRNSTEENVCSKPKSNAKQLEGKLLEALQSNAKADNNFTEQISEVAKIDDIAITSNTVSVEVTNRLVTLEKENQELTARMEKMEQRIAGLEKALQVATAAAAAAASRPAEKTAPPPKQPAPQQSNDDDDDGVDLFGSDSEEEDTEAAKIKEQRLAEYAARKAKKPVLIAKSNIILDVKPWDDETDMKLLEAEVRKIQTDGLVWGASKLVPLAYGIHKLQISCVVEDEKVSVDWLQETIQEIEDYVQSVDIAAFNKV